MIRESRLLRAAATGAAMFLVVVPLETPALVCSGNVLHTETTTAGSGPGDPGFHPVPDCSGTDTFRFIDGLASVTSFADTPAFVGSDWVTALHIDFPSATGGPGLVSPEAPAVETFFRNVTDATSWLVSISGSSLRFEAPGDAARLDPGDLFQWAAFYDTTVPADVDSLRFEIGYTMERVSAPATFALVGLGLVGLAFRLGTRLQAHH